MRYKRRRAAACSGSDGEDEILPSQHRKRAIDAMEGRLANLAGEVSALQSQLEDLRKLHGELAAEGDLLQARLQGVPQEVNLVHRQSEAQALGSGSTRGSDPGSTFHFSIFTTAEPASPGGHGSAERRRPQSKSCRTAPDARSADDQTDQLAQPNPMPMDFWDEIMMPNYQDEYAEAEVAASSEGVLQFAAGSTTGSPAAGVNPPLNSSIRTPAPPPASSAVSLMPASGVGGFTHLAPTPISGMASASPSSDAPGLMPVNAIGQGLTKIFGYPDGATGLLSEPISSGGPSNVPGMESLWWRQQQQLAQQYMEPVPFPQHLNPPLVQAAQRTLSVPSMAMTGQPLPSAASSPRLSSQHQLRTRQSQPLLQQHQQPGSYLLPGDVPVRRRPRWISWPPDSVPADIALLARNGVAVAGESGDGVPASDTASVAVAAANETAAVTGDTTTGIPWASATGSWLGTSPGPPVTTSATPSTPLQSAVSAPQAAQRTTTAANANPTGTVSSFIGSSREAAAGVLGGDLMGFSLASRFANGVRGPLTRGGRGYPVSGPAAAAAALLHDAGMAPAAGMGMGGSISALATGVMGMGSVINGTGDRISAGAELMRSAPSAESVAAMQDQQSQQQQQQRQAHERQEQQILQMQLQEQQQFVQQHMQNMQLHPAPRVKVESPDRLVGFYNTTNVGLSAKSTGIAGAGTYLHGRAPPLSAWSSTAGSSICQEPAAGAVEGGAAADEPGVSQAVDRLGSLTSIGSGSGAVSAATQVAERMPATSSDAGGTRQGKLACRDTPDATEHSPQLQPLSRSRSGSGGGGVLVVAAGTLPMPGPGPIVTPYGHPWPAPYGSPPPPYAPPYNSPYPVPMRYGSSPAIRPVMWRRMAIRPPPPALMPPLTLPGPPALAPPGPVSVCTTPIGKYSPGPLPQTGLLSQPSGQLPPPPLETAGAAPTAAVSGAVASPTVRSGGRPSASYSVGPQGGVLS